MEPRCANSTVTMSRWSAEVPRLKTAFTAFSCSCFLSLSFQVRLALQRRGCPSYFGDLSLQSLFNRRGGKRVRRFLLKKGLRKKTITRFVPRCRAIGPSTDRGALAGSKGFSTSSGLSGLGSGTKPAGQNSRADARAPRSITGKRAKSNSELK